MKIIKPEAFILSVSGFKHSVLTEEAISTSDESILYSPKFIFYKLFKKYLPILDFPSSENLESLEKIHNLS